MNILVALALLVGLGCERPMVVQHKQFVTLDFLANRVAVIGDSYTTGGPLGGQGSRGWTSLAWKSLNRNWSPISADVGAEGGAGYGVRGNAGSLFQDLTSRTVKPDDNLIVFFGSRNDEPVDPAAVSMFAFTTFSLARSIAPNAAVLVIGPPWPTANPPDAILQVRDALRYQAGVAGAAFVDPIAEGWFVGRPNLIGPDGIHPNDAGHEYMAAMIAPLIGSRLPARL